MTDIAPQFSMWIQQLRAVAQTGLAFEPHIYDRERYEQLLELAARMASTVNGNAQLNVELAETLRAKWRAEVGRGVPGYVTPKVGVGAIAFNDRDELFLIKQAEGYWFFSDRLVRHWHVSGGNRRQRNARRSRTSRDAASHHRRIR